MQDKNMLGKKMAMMMKLNNNMQMMQLLGLVTIPFAIQLQFSILAKGKISLISALVVGHQGLSKKN